MLLLLLRPRPRRQHRQRQRRRPRRRQILPCPPHCAHMADLWDGFTQEQRHALASPAQEAAVCATVDDLQAAARRRRELEESERREEQRRVVAVQAAAHQQADATYTQRSQQQRNTLKGFQDRRVKDAAVAGRVADEVAALQATLEETNGCSA